VTVTVLAHAPTLLATAVNFGETVGTLACAFAAAGPAYREKYRRPPPLGEERLDGGVLGRVVGLLGAELGLPLRDARDGVSRGQGAGDDAAVGEADHEGGVGADHAAGAGERRR
jgi:hypothetical protein